MNIEILGCYGSLEHYGRKEPDNEYVTGNVELVKKEDGCVYVNLRMERIEYPYHYFRMFKRDHAAGVILDIGEITKVLAQSCVSPFWAEPSWGELNEAIDYQYLLLKVKEEYIFVLPIANENYAAVATIVDGKIELNVNMLYSGALSMNGSLAVMAKADNPYAAIKNGFVSAYKSGLIKTRVKTEKSYPQVLNGIGWCSWNAFYHDVTEEKLLNKLEEFREKKIPVKWILIDDGWSEFEEMKLLSIYEDRKKFPQGLKHTVQIMKEQYGIEKVGVWHSLTGYWYGINENEIDKNLLKNSIIHTAQERYIPCGYEFFSKWHTYLKEQGIDFVKVDCQGNTIEFLMNEKNALGKIVDIMDGLEISAKENFDFMINCMGMNSINVFQHQSSVLMRSSDDFFPNKKDGFYQHVVNNVYNAVFMDELFYCDYDMWWSEHFDAKRNAVLRFLSGGPVYLSDELGKTNAEYINLFLQEDGTFCRFEQALKPTFDCLFGFDKILKTYNKCDNQYIIAVFSFDQAGSVLISASDFGEQGNYRVKEIFGKQEYLLSENQSISIEMNENEVEVFVFESVEEKQ